MIIDDDSGLARILAPNSVIAVVGLSAAFWRPSHGVAKYLLAQGYRVIPVNPAETQILGQKCYASLADIPISVDIVDVFRKSAALDDIAAGAIAIRARVLWMQLGVINVEAAQMASAAGLDVVMDRCIKIEHARLK